MNSLIIKSGYNVAEIFRCGYLTTEIMSPLKRLSGWEWADIQLQKRKWE